MPALPELRIASPCSANWDAMVGDGRVRYCSQCKLNVYNFSEMTSAEIRQLIAERTGRLCGRFYQRSDGTMLTKNCPVGSRAAMLRTSRAAAAAITALVSISPAIARAGQTQRPTPHAQQVEQAFTVEVLDVAGAAISNATVTLVNEHTTDRFSSSTGSDGKTRFSASLADFYDLAATAAGFRTTVRKHIDISTGRITVRLEIAALMGEIVMVIPTTNAPLPDWTSSNPSSSPGTSSATDLVTLFHHLVSRLRRP
jgi:Carboxypeptidase regulatory-like domain